MSAMVPYNFCPQSSEQSSDRNIEINSASQPMILCCFTNVSDLNSPCYNDFTHWSLCSKCSVQFCIVAILNCMSNNIIIVQII